MAGTEIATGELVETTQHGGLGAGERRLVSIYRAGSVGDRHAPITNIVIEKEVEGLPSDFSREEWKGFYSDQGKALSDALFNSLPGGTIDALLCEMMERRRSLRRVLF